MHLFDVLAGSSGSCSLLETLYLGVGPTSLRFEWVSFRTTLARAGKLFIDPVLGTLE